MKLVYSSAFVLLLISLQFLTSCSKYTEGSKFTLLTKKARLVGDWKQTEMTINEISQDISETSFEISFESNFKYSDTTEFYFGGVEYTFSNNGTWQFSDDKTKLITTDSDGDQITYTIVRLANKELKLKEVVGATTTITTFDAQ